MPPHTSGIFSFSIRRVTLFEDFSLNYLRLRRHFSKRRFELDELVYATDASRRFYDAIASAPDDFMIGR